MPLMESKVSHISKMRRSRQRGFTLLEIMVVIVILGLLASLTIPSLMGNKEKADRQKAASDIVALENALDMYKLDNGRYPSAEQGLAALVTRPALAPIPRNYPEDGYIRRLPQDPWGRSTVCAIRGVTASWTCFLWGRTASPTPMTISATGWPTPTRHEAYTWLYAAGDHTGIAAAGGDQRPGDAEFSGG